MHPLDGAFERMDRALECLTELEAIQKSHEMDQVPIVTIHEAPEILKAADPERLFIAEIEFAGLDVPATFRSILLDAFGHLRAALDELVAVLARQESGEVQDLAQSPLERSADLFARRRDTSLKGVSDVHIAAIEALQPYLGGRWAEFLAEANEDDGSLPDIVTSPSANYRLFTGRSGSFAGLPHVYEAPGSPSLEVHVEFSLESKISFPGGRPLVYSLDEAESDIRAVLEGFRRCLSGACFHV